MEQKPKSRARQKFLSLEPVNLCSIPDNVIREEWIEDVCQKFVCPSVANKSYYRVLLEKLWPFGHGIPGPKIKQNQLRDAIDIFRKRQHSSDKPYKPYVDVFRRMRELQGEEGITGIAREGETYQLVKLTLSEKRIPRIKLSDSDWQKVLDFYHYKCPVCSRSEPEVRFQQDHKVPRTRGGGNEPSNWQPLCDECNNFKSTSCRGCQLECEICSWAFPEFFAPLRLSSDNISKLRHIASSSRCNPHQLLNEIVTRFINQPDQCVDQCIAAVLEITPLTKNEE